MRNSMKNNKLNQTHVRLCRCGVNAHYHYISKSRQEQKFSISHHLTTRNIHYYLAFCLMEHFLFGCYAWLCGATCPIRQDWQHAGHRMKQLNDEIRKLKRTKKNQAKIVICRVIHVQFSGEASWKYTSHDMWSITWCMYAEYPQPVQMLFLIWSGCVLLKFGKMIMQHQQ